MRGPNLSNDHRHRIVCILFEHTKYGRPERGKMQEVADQFGVDRKTIFRIWTLAKGQRLNGDEVDIHSKIKGKKGRPTIEVPVERIVAIPMGERTSLITFSKAVGVSPSTIQNWVKQKKIRSHTSALKPSLTDENKFHRMWFALSQLRYDRISNSLKFKEMSNDIHMDEKWFYITQDQAKFFLLMEEMNPYRSCKSKSFITKVMFMSAVSRPIYDGNGTLLFDGKIGIFPFTFMDPAKRNSKNRPAGTLETKSIASITKQVVKDMLMSKILPAIKSKWPRNMSKNINIQQDNAKPHIRCTDQDFVTAATSDGFNITLTQQPPNSPDLNAWDEEPPLCLDDVWLSLQAVMLEVLKNKGHNNFKLPHLGKKAQRAAGTLPRNLDANQDIVMECLHELNAAGKDQGLEHITVPMAVNQQI
ncbi:uncharacterized protein LOC141653923 [Silene latifolia]|uniref:uncharacterized protein LOC141653923 n=1 Tax=Silene latifolia TaxID=37657 RepID=UPI003D775952